jgi:hypothetical protein
MTNSQRLAAVRTALRQWIAERHPGRDDSGKPLSEAMLIRDGYFCGRRFRFQLYHAVWFIEEDEVKILGPDGAIAARLSSQEIDALARCFGERTREQHTLSISAHLENTLPGAAAQQRAAEQRIAQAPQRRAA